MASRFTLVNRGYNVEKAGPSSVNRLLRPPRRVGEIAEVDLRDQKNALGPAAKVKLKPKQPERDEAIPTPSSIEGVSRISLMEIEELAEEERSAEETIAFTESPVGIGIALAVPGAGLVSLGANYGAKRKLSDIDFERGRRKSVLRQRQELPSEITSRVPLREILLAGRHRTAPDPMDPTTSDYWDIRREKEDHQSKQLYDKGTYDDDPESSRGDPTGYSGADPAEPPDKGTGGF